MSYNQSAAQAAARARLISNPVTGYDGLPIDPNSFNVNGGLLFASSTNPDLYNTPKNTWLPRFGFAYQWNPKTVIRGGVGVFAGFLGERRGDVIQPGYTRTTQVSLSTLASGAPIPQNIASGFITTPVLEPVGNAQGPQTFLGNSISFFNQKSRRFEASSISNRTPARFRLGCVS